MLARQGHGFLKRGFVHHQAGSGENAFLMGADHGLVDGDRAAEVIGIDDEAAASRRRGARANRHN
jgi:hydrogenase/urease accessory protein HupE